MPRLDLGDRRLSAQLSFQEIAQRQSILQLLFDKYGDGEGVGSSQLVAVARDGGLLNKTLSEKAVMHIFDSVKLSGKKVLGLDRFEEAFRKMAVARGLTYTAR